MKKGLNVYPFNFERVQHKGLIIRFLTKFFPFYFLESFTFEFRNAFWRILAPLTRLRFKGSKGLLVNIGCGKHGRNGWVNIDCFKARGVNCLYDVRKDLPFEDNSVAGIFVEHVVEHFDYTEEIPRFMSECYRCLEKGGVLRIVVPDAGRYLTAYSSEGWKDLQQLRPLEDEKKDFWFKHDYHSKMELINAVFRQGQQHKFAYDAETLEFLLKYYGFNFVKQQAFGESLKMPICLDTPSRASESLYMEAVK